MFCNIFIATKMNRTRPLALAKHMFVATKMNPISRSTLRRKPFFCSHVSQVTRRAIGVVVGKTLGKSVGDHYFYLLVPFISRIFLEQILEKWCYKSNSKSLFISFCINRIDILMNKSPPTTGSLIRSSNIVIIYS